ncbi:DUF5343 domain-containing protein [Idiomarina abyssalis]|uniref:DUF5343 domain-containing protein n=1 Tax=Idiomarina abyssalis TaxID=86102 RepID=UPI002301E972|nr:DUF5343 domain-containing protein [Idiomarina abyssalis]MDA6067630.1 DUF5343 domain-containing protein [Idiomarina abyssalis]
MALPGVYTQVYGQLPSFLATIREGQAPDKFTQQHLKDLGYASSNYRSYIPILKAIGFLSADGTPTDRYRAHRDSTQSRRVLGEALKEAYAELFVIKSHPTDKDKDALAGKFKSVHNATDRTAELMAKTFLALLKEADIDHAPSKGPKAQAKEEPRAEPKKEEAPTREKKIEPPGLHYNIQIHLPATKDVEVYNAIFKSLREHLID